MKRFTKIMLSAGGALLIGTGAAMSYLKAQQPEPQVSDLTLANIEALALDIKVSGKSECTGWLGWCSFTCECGYSFSALGSTFINRHHCSRN